jgi:N-acetylmuramoyl-L-alanine amidase
MNRLYLRKNKASQPFVDFSVFNKKFCFTKNNTRFTFTMKFIYLFLFLFGLISCSNHQKKVMPARFINPEADTSFIVLIDAGHGGKDGGASDTIKQHTDRKMFEKTMVFQIAQAVKKNCENENIKVMLTRDRDTFYFLKSRLSIAKNIRPNLLISLHANTFTEDSTLRGVEVYTVNKNHPYFKESVECGDELQKNLCEIPSVKMRGWKISPHRLFLMHNSIAPALLLEMGNLFNKEDYLLLSGSKGQNDIAAALTKTIEWFYNKHGNPDIRLHKRLPNEKTHRTIKAAQAMGDYAVVLVDGVEYNSELLTEIDTTKIANVYIRPPVYKDFVKYGFIAKDSIIELTTCNPDSPFIFKTETDKQAFWKAKK